MATFRPAISALALLTFAAMSAAQNGNGSKPLALLVGDAAPKLTVSKWVKGAPVKKFEKGQVYVVEFWATWCGPCKTSIPHITDLQKKFGEKARFVGVSIWESDQKLVEPFVKEMGDKMGYTVAMDQLPNEKAQAQEGAMAKTWMEASNQQGIPSAFIIDKEGMIAWIGHPMEIDEPLHKVVEGTWDTKAFIELKREETEKMAKLGEFRKMLSASIKAKDWETALKVCDDMIAAGFVDMGGQNKFAIAMKQIKDYDRAYAIGRELAAGVFKDNSNALNSIAWTIVDPKAKPEKRDLELALMAAERSVELDKNWANLDTLARVWFSKGDKAKAIALQKEAIGMAPDENSKAELEAALKEYEG